MTKPLILIVEDEFEYAEKIANAVKSSNKYDAIIAHSAPQALATLKKNKIFFGLLPNRISCILLDIKMPGMNGLEFLKEVRQNYKDTVGVFMLTAYEDVEKWDKALEGFVACYIKKPFDRHDLLSRLDKFFSEDKEVANKMISKTLVEGIERMEELRKEEKDKTT